MNRPAARPAPKDESMRGIHFGAMADRLSVQLHVCGYSDEEVSKFQALADAVTLLYIHDMIEPAKAAEVRVRIARSMGFRKGKRGG